jgi:hypothetical protein
MLNHCHIHVLRDLGNLAFTIIVLLLGDTHIPFVCNHQGQAVLIAHALV